MRRCVCATGCIGFAINRLSRVCGARFDQASPDLTASIASRKAEEISSILYHLKEHSIKYNFPISTVDEQDVYSLLLNTAYWSRPHQQTLNALLAYNPLVAVPPFNIVKQRNAITAARHSQVFLGPSWQYVQRHREEEQLLSERRRRSHTLQFQGTPGNVVNSTYISFKPAVRKRERLEDVVNANGQLAVVNGPTGGFFSATVWFGELSAFSLFLCSLYLSTLV